MSWPHHCRRCHAALTGRDVFDFRDSSLSYAAVLRGHDAASLQALLSSLEERHRGGVTEWCPCCKSFGVLFFPLCHAHKGTPPGSAAAEYLLTLEELSTLLDISERGVTPPCRPGP